MSKPLTVFTVVEKLQEALFDMRDLAEKQEIPFVGAVFTDVALVYRDDPTPSFWKFTVEPLDAVGIIGPEPTISDIDSYNETREVVETMGLPDEDEEPGEPMTGEEFIEKMEGVLGPRPETTSDETDYLTQSPENARRLRESLEQTTVAAADPPSEPNADAPVP